MQGLAGLGEQRRTRCMAIGWLCSKSYCQMLYRYWAMLFISVWLRVVLCVRLIHRRSCSCCCLFFFTDLIAPVGLGLLCDVTRSHSETPHTVGLLWTSDQPIAETSTWQHTTFTRDKHPRPWRDSNLKFQQASSCWPTPWTARLLESAFCCLTRYKIT
jgi:hypothetical protein